MAGEALRGFPKTIQTALLDGKIDYAVRLFNEEKYSGEVKNNAWDLVPVVTEYLVEETRRNNYELFKCCKHLLDIISERSNPDEALLQFVSDVEEAKENCKFIALLDPLYKTICRISCTKINSFAWSFNAIQTYIRQCELPEYENLEGKERLLVDNSDVVNNIVNLYTEVLIFYGKIIDSVQNSTNQMIKKILRKFLVQLLGTPLCYLNMELFGTMKTDGRSVTEDLLGKLFSIMTDPFVLSEMINEKEHDELTKPDTLSVANFFYLVYCEGICFEKIPKVYNSRHIFESIVPLLRVLLNSGNNILIEKAFKLAHFVSLLLRGQELPYLFLDCEDHCKLFVDLSNIIIYNQFETTRKAALIIFTNYLKSFETKGMYLIISNLITVLPHSGLKGYLITFYKDRLSNEFQQNEQNMADCFKGPKLFYLLRKFCHLKDKEKTDLMDNSDQIVSTLNLLRYILLRDKNNTTKLWDFFPILENIYLEPLQKGLEVSRAHYELEIKNLNEENEGKKREAEIAVSVYGKSIAKMEKEDKLKVLNSSLTAFDVMQSLLSRVVEILGHKTS